MRSRPEPLAVRGGGTASAAGEVEAVLRRLDRFAFLLDAALRIPGTRWRIGLDGLLGFIPGLGDAATGLIALYPIIEAWRLGAPPAVLARMLGNLGLDLAVGTVPLLGDVFDVAFKANRRNVHLLRRHLESAARV